MQFNIRESGLAVPVAEKPEKTNSEIHDEYRLLHACCPECGGDDIETTCMGFIFTSMETAKNRNHAYCQCGWKGIVHDMVAMDDGGKGQ